jgi:hypothetical protein
VTHVTEHTRRISVTTPTMDVLDIIRKHADEADIDFLRETG